VLTPAAVCDSFHGHEIVNRTRSSAVLDAPVKDTRERAMWEWENGRTIPGAAEWLTEHWTELAGLWVAVGPSGLVGAADTLDELEAEIGHFKGVLLSHVV
jgi:hypothetical protein